MAGLGGMPAAELLRIKVLTLCQYIFIRFYIKCFIKIQQNLGVKDGGNIIGQIYKYAEKWMDGWMDGQKWCAHKNVFHIHIQTE
jgi:hypothetical protein